MPGSGAPEAFQTYCKRTPAQLTASLLHMLVLSLYLEPAQPLQCWVSSERGPGVKLGHQHWAGGVQLLPAAPGMDLQSSPLAV